MTASESSPRSEPEFAGPETTDATRRTWLAAERTWLARWRTGIGAAALAIGIGRLLPATTHGASWPFRRLGIAYGLLAIGILLAGALRQRRTAQTLRRGNYAPLSTRLVTCFTAVAVVLSAGAVILIGVRL